MVLALLMWLCSESLVSSARLGCNVMSTLFKGFYMGLWGWVKENSIRYKQISVLEQENCGDIKDYIGLSSSFPK